MVNLPSCQRAGVVLEKLPWRTGVLVWDGEECWLKRQWGGGGEESHHGGLEKILTGPVWFEQTRQKTEHNTSVW